MITSGLFAFVTLLAVLAAYGLVYLMDRFCEWQDSRARKSDIRRAGGA